MRPSVAIAVLGTVVVLVLGVAALVGVVPVSGGPTAELGTAEVGPSDGDRRTSHQPGERCEIGFSAVGASFTQGNAWNPNGTRMRSDVIDPSSWVYWADQDDRLRLEGGWALAGQRTGDVADRVQPDWFPSDTELVLLLGTNDALLGAEPDSVGPHLQRIVDVAGARPEQVTVVLLPPNDHAPGRIKEINAELRRVAAQQEWAMVDVGPAMDDGLGWFRDGVSSDGTHLTEPWAQFTGETVAAALRADNPC